MQSDEEDENENEINQYEYENEVNNTISYSKDLQSQQSSINESSKELKRNEFQQQQNDKCIIDSENEKKDHNAKIKQDKAPKIDNVSQTISHKPISSTSSEYQMHQPSLYELFGAPSLFYPHTYFQARTNPFANSNEQNLRARNFAILSHKKNYSQFSMEESQKKLYQTEKYYLDQHNEAHKGNYWKDTTNLKEEDFGNGLVFISCETSSRNKNQRYPEKIHFMIHPTGRGLNCVSITRIRLPCEDATSNISMKNDNKCTINVGGRVRQIILFGGIPDKSWRHSFSSSCEHKYYFLVRTQFKITVLHCSIHIRAYNVNANEFNSTNNDCVRVFLEQMCRTNQNEQINSKSTNGIPTKKDMLEILHCTGYAYPTSTKISEIDPFDISFLSPPLCFAYLEKQSNPYDSNYIQNVTIHPSSTCPIVQKHTFPSIRNMQYIQYSRTHPKLVWSAASSTISPYGRGRLASSSLYRLDLRCNSAAFLFSPSNLHNYMEGAVGITGIYHYPASTSSMYNDDIAVVEDHTVFVTTNMRECIELDARMPGPVQVKNTWRLNGVGEGLLGVNVGNDLIDILPEALEKQNHDDDSDDYDDYHQSKTRKPKDKPSFVASDEKKNRIILQLSQKKGVFGFNLLQPPHLEPRFGTSPLEAGMSMDASLSNGDCVTENFGSGCISRSSLFALVDQSNQKVFHCGIGHIMIPIKDPNFIRTSKTARNVSSFRKQLPQSYISDDSFALIVFTLTNLGNIYCHTLLPCNRSMSRKSILYENCPVGSRSIPIPEECCTRDDSVWDSEEDFVKNMDSVVSSFLRGYVEGVFDPPFEKDHNESDGNDENAIHMENSNENENIPLMNQLQIALCNRYPQPEVTFFMPEVSPYVTDRNRRSFPPIVDLRSMFHYYKEEEDLILEKFTKDVSSEEDLLKALKFYLTESPRTLFEIRRFLEKHNVNVSSRFQSYRNLQKWIQDNLDANENVTQADTTIQEKGCVKFKDLALPPAIDEMAEDCTLSVTEEESIGREIFHFKVDDGVGAVHTTFLDEKTKKKEEENACINTSENKSNRDGNKINVITLSATDPHDVYQCDEQHKNRFMVPAEFLRVAHIRDYQKKIEKQDIFEIENEEDNLEMLVSEKGYSDMATNKLIHFELKWDEESVPEDEILSTKSEDRDIPQLQKQTFHAKKEEEEDEEDALFSHL